MHVVIYEGIHWHSFAPVALGRPVFMLATGTTTLLEKQIRHTKPTRLTLWVRDDLEAVVKERIVPKMPVPTQVNVPLDDEPALLLSGRTLHFHDYDVPNEPSVVLDEGSSGAVVRTALVQKMAGLSHQDVMNRTERWLKLADLPHMPPQTRLVERLWDLIKWNEESLIQDFAHLKRPCGDSPAGPYHLLDSEHICIDPSAKIGPGAVLDGSKGPVMVDHHASIGPCAVIEGPCYIGPYANIAAHATIHPGTSIGMMCKVGGEVANTIMFGYSNKVHEGFLGDSYIGKWVNFGAGTITSNLKNTYGEISVKTRNGLEKTGRRFLGSLVGDHAKTAIGTRLMAGTYLGFNSMVAVSGYAPAVVPSFTFLQDSGAKPYDLGKAMEVQKAVFARRNRGWDAVDEYITRYVAKIAPGVE